ncbi:MAG: hypothetical protein ACI87J_002461 [Colwellia sp.]|jgi:hypothetical protein|uniref:hypothetical protein n=1 Tax=Colwellia sp. BRX8-9 TaxID=2759831 RepID=UPI0015F6EE10|nr:hypothetical protein [Colwellia sp. BRX8-9]MBA6350318.1 hypothetical protein [Colwellia sp. BRX8-9]
MKYLLFPILFIIFCTSSAFACSPGTISHFYIDLDADIEWSSDLFPPEIKSINIERGQFPCNHGKLKIEVTLPKNSFYKITDVGFYFIHDNSDFIDSIYPDNPLIVKESEDGRFYLEFEWLDFEKKLKTSFYLVTVLKDSSISSLSKLIMINDKTEYIKPLKQDK